MLSPTYYFRSPSAGKLISYTVEDGGHVFQGETYAEIEVTILLYGGFGGQVVSALAFHL
jgi:hypothetical protein